MPFSLGFWANTVAASAWSVVAAPNTAELNWNSIAYVSLTNGNWFAVPQDGTAPTSYWYSTDGVSWTEASMPAVDSTWIFIAGSGKLVAIRDSTGSGGVYYTTNGTTWTSATMPSATYTFNKGIWDGTRFLVVTTDTGSGGLVWDVDGAGTWSAIDVGFGGYDIAYDGTSRYVVTSATSTNIHRTCTSDPTVAGNWSNITLPATDLWRTVAYGNGTWVALIDNSTTYATSTNGTTWTSRTLSKANTNDNDSRMTFARGYFYYSSVPVGTSGTSSIMRSADGITWTEVLAADRFNGAMSWAASSSKIIAVGSAGTTGKFIVGA